ncbi:MAG: phosphate-starvation-inducible PsiE family protein [Campylobacterales bacterium]|nr:phosphate-starvation-inducible PsiE family protein [Campylobacterales bacterium]
MNKLAEFYQSKFYIEIILATVLFMVAVSTDSMVNVIIYLLYFIIMLEIVRAVMSFIREKRVQIRILIDAFIILTLREFIVNVVKINKEDIEGIDMLFTNSTNFHILIFSGVLVFLFMLRWFALMTTPDKYKNYEASEEGEIK